VGPDVTETPKRSPPSGGAMTVGLTPRIRDFSEALRRGDTQAASEAARDACLAEPNRAEPHYAYGQAWVAAGKPARAEQAFAIATKLRPGFADAWVNYGPRPAGTAWPRRSDNQSRGALAPHRRL
jgi:Tfp pilus assembly protein PilF